MSGLRSGLRLFPASAGSNLTATRRPLPPQLCFLTGPNKAAGPVSKCRVNRPSWRLGRPFLHGHLGWLLTPIGRLRTRREPCRRVTGDDGNRGWDQPAWRCRPCAAVVHRALSGGADAHIQLTACRERHGGASHRRDPKGVKAAPMPEIEGILRSLIIPGPGQRHVQGLLREPHPITQRPL